MWFKFWLTALFLCSIGSSKSILSFENEEILIQTFYEEFLKYFQTGNRSSTLLDLYEYLRNPEEYSKDPKIDPICLLCRTSMTTGFNLRRVIGATRNELFETAAEVCYQFGIFPSREMCAGFTDLNIDPILFAIDYQPALTPSSFCAISLQGTCGEAIEPEFNFKLQVEPSMDVIREHKKASLRSGKSFKIIHLADIHYDPKYVVGNTRKCDEFVCCRESQGLPVNPDDAAKYWGEYSCNSPWHTINEIISHISETHQDVRFVYYTGDGINHAVWETTIEGNLKIMSTIDSLFKEKFKDIPVFQSLGNHEGQPNDVFAPEGILNPKLSSSWLYNYTAEAWRTWLPPSSALTILRGGYYTVSPLPGFRIISLNNNVCHNFNWWNMYNMQVLKVQLIWLHDTLQSAEKADERVHILYHMPVGTTCYKVWAREFNRIVERFYKIIAGQFNGHTHHDEFRLYYDQQNQKFAINVVWVGGSMTAFTDINPSYRIYEVDDESFEVLESETWYFNLTLANETPQERPKWEVLYNFREAYGVADLSPANLNDLVDRLSTDQELLKNYWQNKVKRGDNYMKGGCDELCLRNALCAIVSVEVGDDRKCQEIVK